MKKAVFASIILFLVPFVSASAQTAHELLSKGHEAFLNYDFDAAADFYAKAKKKVKKADENFSTRYDEYNSKLTMARNFLNRVEKIVIIDSITVPRQNFFKAYRLPQSAGSLDGAAAVPDVANDTIDIDFVFTNEGGDYKLWAQPDTTGYSHLVESSLLTDGSWSLPNPLSDELAEDCDAIFPFMMADGVTLYYAANGENSLGGYDIMIATRDPSDGSFLQPSNLGFPYNSPYDDYLLAIDELNGVGWWATDRNQLDDLITIYVFVSNDMRVNYPVDEEGLEDYAKITDFIATQPEDGDFDELLETIRSIDPEASVKKPEFTFAASKGRIYHRFDELPSNESRVALKRYFSAQDNFDKHSNMLAGLRRKFAESNSSQIASQIRRLEQESDQLRSEVRKLFSDVHKSLAKYNR